MNFIFRCTARTVDYPSRVSPSSSPRVAGQRITFSVLHRRLHLHKKRKRAIHNTWVYVCRESLRWSSRTSHAFRHRYFPMITASPVTWIRRISTRISHPSPMLTGSIADCAWFVTRVKTVGAITSPSMKPTLNSVGKFLHFSNLFHYIIFTNKFFSIFREILRHTQRLSNPVWYRHSRQTLLRLRQRYPEKFQVSFFTYRLFFLSSCSYSCLPLIHSISRKDKQKSNWSSVH